MCKRINNFTCGYSMARHGSETKASTTWLPVHVLCPMLVSYNIKLCKQMISRLFIIYLKLDRHHY